MTWLRNQMEARGLTQRDVAAIAGMTEQMFTNVIKGRRQMHLEEADRIRRSFGYILPEDAPISIAVAGKVGAGDHVRLVDDYAKGAGLFQIARPQWIPARNVVAAIVDGTSAEPFACNGDIIFWRRDALAVHTEDLGRAVVAETEDGRILLKRLASSSRPGHWSLLSINPSHPNLMDVRLLWAARVLAPLPADEINHLDG